ncbi:MAG: response regulator [Planctomycetota bacterium]
MHDDSHWESRLSAERTARIRAEEHAAAVEAELDAVRAANRAKSVFLASASRELRSPMNVVVGTASLLGMTDLDDEQREAVETIDRSASALIHIIDQILDLSRVESDGGGLQRDPFDAVDAAALVCHLLGQQVAERSTELVFTAQPDLEPMRVGDELGFRHVVTGLVQNLVRTAEPSTVRVELTGDAAGLRVHASTTAPLSPHAEEEGADGLGLTLARRIVEAMGGSLHCSLDGSVRCHAELPLPAQRGVEADATASKLSPDELVLRGRVLLAEDEPVNRRIITAMLGSAGAEVVAVSNGREALEAFEAGGYDIVLLDWHMPELSGTAAARAMREHERTHGLSPTPLVALTASALAEDAEACLAAGMDAHLAKPIRFESLIAALGPLVERRRSAA